MEYEAHLPCPNESCNGNIIFVGIRDYVTYFKCCICGTEFPNRRAFNVKVTKERRKLWGGEYEVTN